MGTIRIGTCGYQYYDPPTGWKDRFPSKLAAYAAFFNHLEFNRTFYELPMVSTAHRWRDELSEGRGDSGWTVSVKAWQGMTHPISSPTWRNHDDTLSEEEREEVGYLRPNETVRKAWTETRKRAIALNADVIVIQTPPSFDATEDHEANIRDLLGSIDRNSIAIAWEPRGDWSDHPERVEDICRDLDINHISDIMRRPPVYHDELVYTRLHGLNADPTNYDYDYSSAELADLAERLRKLRDDHDTVYCLFNNYEMYANATSLQERLRD